MNSSCDARAASTESVPRLIDQSIDRSIDWPSVPLPEAPNEGGNGL